MITRSTIPPFLPGGGGLETALTGNESTYWPLTHNARNYKCRLCCRPIKATYEDADLVVRWRNDPETRAQFYNQDAVTWDTHFQFMINRKPHDLVMVMHKTDQFQEPVGMFSLTVDVKERIAEAGRALIAPEFRGQHLGVHFEFLQASLAFKHLQLSAIWGEIFTGNERRLAVAEKAGWIIAPPEERHGRQVHIVTLFACTWLERQSDFLAMLEER